MYIPYCVGNNPFNVAGINILNKLNIPFQNLNKQNSSIGGFSYNGGYFGRVGDFSKFLLGNIFNIALAHKQDKKLLALEEDSYANLVHAVHAINNNDKMKKFIEKELDRLDLKLPLDSISTYIAYFPQELSKNLNLLQDKIKLRFNMFKTCIYYGGRHFDASQKNEYSNIDSIFKTINLRTMKDHFSFNYFGHLKNINKSFAFYKSGEILYAGIDMGVDFLTCFSASQFEMLDNVKECTKYYKRDLIKISTLNIYQILLLAMDEAKLCAFELHKNKPDFV